ncbi:MAG: histidine kinase [Alphaproteobacteria bacterium]|nr:histidine kinase [Alphaproteobacteria bacterium]
MPTLIRLFVLLAILGGVAFGGMVALTVFVKPGQEEITQRIPARDLFG